MTETITSGNISTPNLEKSRNSQPHQNDNYQDTKSCQTCYSQIHSLAKKCRHCGSSQVPQKWETIARVLKWTGGITAILSLILASVQANSILNHWRNKNTSIDIYIQSANYQREAGDYVAAWQSYESVLEIDPGNRDVIQEQITLAMRWIQREPLVYSSRKLTNTTFIQDYLDRLQPALYRGIAISSDESYRSSVYANIALLNLQKRQSIDDKRMRANKRHLQRITEDSINTAFKLDSNNDFAHAVKAYSIYYSHDDLTRKDWELALPYIKHIMPNKNSKKITDNIFYFLLFAKTEHGAHWSDYDNFVLTTSLALIRDSDIKLPIDFSFDLFYLLSPRSTNEISTDYATDNFSMLEKSEMMEIFRYIYLNLPHEQYHRKNLVMIMQAKLEEISGNVDTAKEIVEGIYNTEIANGKKRYADLNILEYVNYYKKLSGESIDVETTNSEPSFRAREFDGYGARTF